MTPERRAAAVVWQRRSRERRRERARLLAIAEAERLEKEADAAERFSEALAPFVLRHPVQTPSGYMLVGARIEIQDGKPARVDPVAALKLTDRQRKAGRQIQMDWREVGAGMNYATAGYGRGGGPGDILGSHAVMRRQIDTRARLDGALAFLGAFAPLVAAVILNCIPPAVWACQEGRPAADAPRWIEAALDRLALFYWPEAQGGGRPTERILTFGPPRQAYTLETEGACNDG